MSLGLGSVIASVVEVAPWLAAASRHKGIIFAAVGGLLALNYWLAVVRPRRLACPPGEICHIDSPAMRVSRAIFWTSVAVYVIAVSVSFGAEWWLRIRP